MYNTSEFDDETSFGQNSSSIIDALTFVTSILALIFH